MVKYVSCNYSEFYLEFNCVKFEFELKSNSNSSMCQKIKTCSKELTLSWAVFQPTLTSAGPAQQQPRPSSPGAFFVFSSFVVRWGRPLSRTFSPVAPFSFLPSARAHPAVPARTRLMGRPPVRPARTPSRCARVRGLVPAGMGILPIFPSTALP
jgi:hypothetical protein